MDWQREIEGLRQNLASIPSAPGDGAQKLKESYLQKLNTLETQVPASFGLSAILSHLHTVWFFMMHRPFRFLS